MPVSGCRDRPMDPTLHHSSVGYVRIPKGRRAAGHLPRQVVARGPHAAADLPLPYLELRRLVPREMCDPPM